MADLLQYATHDQIAIAFCFGALVISGGIMHFSVHLGRLTGSLPTRESNHLANLKLQRSDTFAIEQVPAVPTQRDRAA